MQLIKGIVLVVGGRIQRQFPGVSATASGRCPRLDFCCPAGLTILAAGAVAAGGGWGGGVEIVIKPRKIKIDM